MDERNQTRSAWYDYSRRNYRSTAQKDLRKHDVGRSYECWFDTSSHGTFQWSKPNPEALIVPMYILWGES